DPTDLEPLRRGGSRGRPARRAEQRNQEPDPLIFTGEPSMSRYATLLFLLLFGGSLGFATERLHARPGIVATPGLGAKLKRRATIPGLTLGPPLAALFATAATALAGAPANASMVGRSILYGLYGTELFLMTRPRDRTRTQRSELTPPSL